MDVATLSGLVKTLFILALLYLAYIDWRSFRLPNAITLPLIILGLGLNLTSNLRFTDPPSALIGACLGYGVIWALNALYYLLKHRNGIGMGDAKLLSALGAWLGWATLPSILLLASTLGILGGLLWLKWSRHKLHQAFPFGPFLVIAGIIELLWPQIIPTLLIHS
ncbi:A24 family peptidase [Polynucleobacter sp. AP-Nino-20-G2]|uniref:prepilin peptidase n=1 Tax=Polynucleobacter sp. AP-Nino-20-G2 TaxID=2576917 RepID=UPI001BFE50B7|nr:A24 family peptidase [Polynucleobacter sp. AP-Nino-20-G2]QWE16830.1 prepilin peptidase [Polynucleobacter sp. AP-Nino-20-G2]